MKFHRDDDSDEETERTSTTSSMVSSKKPEVSKNEAISDEESSETSSSSLSNISESESEPEVDLRRSKISAIAKEAIKKTTESPVTGKKKMMSLPTQQPVTSTIKKDLQKSRVVRKSLEKSKDLKKEKEIPDKAKEKKAIKKTQAKKIPEEVPKKTNLAANVQKTAAEPGTGVKPRAGSLKTKAGTIQKKKVSESAPSLKNSTKAKKEEETSPNAMPQDTYPKAAKRQSAGSTLKKKLPEPVPNRRLAVKKTEETPMRPQRPTATVKTDGRSGVPGRAQQRKIEPSTRPPPRKSEIQPRGPQSRTAFTMSGLRQASQAKNLVKERLIGQSDQA